MIAIVRPERANDVLEALYRADVRGVSMSRVQGHGGEPGLEDDRAAQLFVNLSIDER